MKRWIALGVAVIGAAMAQAQPVSPEVGEALNRALQLIEARDYAAAGPLLHQVREASPQHPEVLYDLALGYYLSNEPLAAREVLRPSLRHDSAQAHHFQLMGHCFEAEQLPDSAFAYHKAGLRRFPSSGALHMELGKHFMRKGDEEGAIGFWELGIRAEPAFAPNYYHACKFLSASPERLWALLYGEIYLNLAPGTGRAVETSRLLLATYRDAVRFFSDSAFVVRLTNYNVIGADDSGQVFMPFPVAFQTLFSASVARTLLPRRPPGAPLSISEIASARLHFLEAWEAQGRDAGPTNPPIQRLRQVRQAGHWQAYHYWLLGRHEVDEPRAWRAENAEAWQTFVAWVQANPFEVRGASIVCSMLYD